ncbi:S49 family peptidase [uncultured Sneathia sp.]|uniref:S49 family peptidase n=1 Tax=uncultured Sneathia sp. TaxID=278067 RepID=UPI0025979E71|nr:S49 family peptidase [uncultured Sneathia sp.]
MKLFLLTLISSLITAIFVIILLIILSILIFKMSHNDKKEDKCKPKKAKTILITLEDFKYDTEKNPLKQSSSFDVLYAKLNDILNNKKIEKIILDIDKMKLSMVQVEELYPIFKKLNKEKEVIAISTMYTNNSYYTALLANKIYLENTINSTLLLQGYYRKISYLKGILDKVGIDVKAIHIGDYKAMGENYTRKSMSPNLKENLTKIFDERLNNFISFVKERRGVDISNELLEGEYFFNYSEKLIDGRMNKNKLLDDDYLIDITNYNFKEKKNKSKNVIGLISLEGQISKKGLSLEEVEYKIDKINEIDNLKGLVIEIDSPGGSAYESSLIYSYIKENVQVPIFVSMKDVCASGGYFIASTAKKMFANSSTITGSIGVVSIYPTYSKLAKKLDINYSGLEKGKTLEYGNLYEHLSFDTIDRIYDHMNGVYREFKNVVIKARHMSDRRLENIAGGRVFIAKDARYNGLVDGIKNIGEVIEEMQKYLNLPDYRLVKINKKFNVKTYIKSSIPLLKYDEYLNKPLLLFDESIY